MVSYHPVTFGGHRHSGSGDNKENKPLHIKGKLNHFYVKNTPTMIKIVKNFLKMTSDLRKNLTVDSRFALRFLTNFYSFFIFLKEFK